MSDTVEQYYRYRKFCKIIGLHNVFDVYSVFNEIKNDYDTFYKTSQLDENKINTYNESNQLPITKDTILFITADSSDKDKKIEITVGEIDGEGNKIKTTRTLYELDTMLWVNGNIYSLSQKNVKTVFYNDNTDELEIIYSDDSMQSIDITELQLSRKIAVNFPLSISEETGTGDNEKEETFDYISLFGQDKNVSGRNFVIGMYDDEENIPDENKNNYDGCEYTTIIGKGNIASTNRQIILGDFNKVDNSKFIVCDGVSNERKNLFTISNDGIVLALDDFVLSKETNKNTHKLSDIHNVVDDDWYKETKDNIGQYLPEGSFDIDPELGGLPGGSIDR